MDSRQQKIEEIVNKKYKIGNAEYIYKIENNINYEIKEQKYFQVTYASLNTNKEGD